MNGDDVLGERWNVENIVEDNSESLIVETGAAEIKSSAVFWFHGASVADTDSLACRANVRHFVWRSGYVACGSRIE